MEQRKRRKVISVILCMALVITMLSGCGEKKRDSKMSDAQETETVAAKAEEEIVQPQLVEESEEAPTTFIPLASGGKGRYVEEEMEKLIEGTTNYGKLQKTGEGIWVFGDSKAWFRKNGSEEFEAVNYPQVIRDSYVTGAAVNDQGDMVFACYESNESETILRAVKRDGTVIDMEHLNQRELTDRMEFGPDGKLYVHRYGGISGIYRYELKEGEGEYLFFTTSTVEDITFVGNCLLALDDGQVWVFDVETDTPKEQDTVLDEFCKENLTGLGGYGEGVRAACLFNSEEENVVYIVNAKGIFRHVLYGSVMEQVVNGDLNTLSNPRTCLYGAVSWQDENGNVAFLVDTYPANLLNFIYDPDIPTVPEKQLYVYSLEENSDLRQIISLFQKTYPECYVKYEVGFSGEGAANVEDIIKNLNTAMLSGNGPDVLITDGLTENNYSNKGLLMDLAPLVEEMTGEDALLPNLVEALKQDGKIYSLPVVFRIPMLAGEKDLIEDIHDACSLTEAVENYRENNPERVIITSTLPEGILGVLAQMECGNWIKDGSLDENALKETISCAYRLYEVENKGDLEKMAKQEQNLLKNAVFRISPRLTTRIQSLYYNYFETLREVMSKEKLAAIGYAGYPMELCWVDQLPEDYDFAALEDGRGVGFKPVIKLAVNAGSSEQEMAQKFVKFALSFKAGELELRSGIPLNAAASERTMQDEKAKGWSYSFSGTNVFEEPIGATASWPSEKTLSKYQDAIASVNHVIVEEPYLTEQVIEIGAKAMQEGKSVDEAVAEIKKKTALYLAE